MSSSDISVALDSPPRLLPFAEKNAARVAGRFNGKPDERRYARKLRRADGGAFGNRTSSEWNDRIIGTTGVRR